MEQSHFPRLFFCLFIEIIWPYPGARVANHAMCSDEYCSLWGMAADSNDRMEFFQERGYGLGWVRLGKFFLFAELDA